MKLIKTVFDDWLSRSAGIIFILILALVIFNTNSDFPEEHPLFGVFNFALVPVLFIAGGIVFVIAILRETRLREGTPVNPIHRGKFVFLMSFGALGIGLLVIGGYQLIEFTDSTAFCGRLCHEVMYPEYTTHQASPHSRVTCAECHVGSGAEYLVKSKLSGIPQIINTMSGSYPRPIPTPVENLRPARDTCEQCHRPERFAGDLVRQHTTFASDENNTSKVDIRVLRVGGGEAGVAQDIHWHIAAQVWYVANDDKRQDIVWVGIENDNGDLTEYYDLAAGGAGLPQEEIEENKRLMDCMDCHNRATHIYYSPNELLNTALSQGTVSADLPYIKREGLAVLERKYDSLDAALAEIEAIRDFYDDNYPQVAQSQAASLESSIEELKEIARLTVFTDMNVSWTTYIDNSSHTEYPGCFRCHGKLTALSGNLQGKKIDKDCESCHYFDLQ